MAERKGASYRITSKRPGGSHEGHTQETQSSDWSRYWSHPDPEEERIERKQEQYREEGPDWGL
jgi:hypothetical protein